MKGWTGQIPASAIIATKTSFVKNSQHIFEIEMLLEDHFISFDVEGLYTNVPVKEVFGIIKTRLETSIEVRKKHRYQKMP